MPAKNRRTDAIVAWVRANPGKLGRELGAALGFDHSSGLLSYLVKQRIVFVAGPRHWQRYYPTFDLAMANDRKLLFVVSEAVQTHRHAFEAGFDHHMVKPVRFERIEEILSNRSVVGKLRT